MSPLLTAVTIALSGILGGAGTVAIVRALARKNLTRADVAASLSDSTLKWVEQFQEEAGAARREAADMRREAADARREAAEARVEWRQMRLQMSREMQELVDQIHRVRVAAWRPTATIEQVRAVINGLANTAEAAATAPKSD